MRTAGKALAVWLTGVAIVGCRDGVTTTPSREVIVTPGPSSGSLTLTPPTPESPLDLEQLSTLRPTLVVRNGTSNRAGARTYEFQIADRADFSGATAGPGTLAVVVSRTVPEGTTTTTLALDQDLPATTRFFWRVRIRQDTATSDWSDTRAFNSRLVGFSRSGELYDPLVHGETLGTAIGSTTFLPGRGIQLNDQNAYVRYQLPQTVTAGEFSMEVEGLAPNGPNHKLKIFSMLDGPGDLLQSKFQAAAHYRGLTGNPDNCIAFKVVWGDNGVILEPDLAKRLSSVVFLDRSKTYLWQGTWDTRSFRLVVRDGAAIVHDNTITAPAGTGPYAPSPHFAYLGANSGAFGSDAGSFPGMIIRNVWLGDRPRPTLPAGATTRR